MQPIDKFQWNNINKEKELLEYISILENIAVRRKFAKTAIIN